MLSYLCYSRKEAYTNSLMHHEGHLSYIAPINTAHPTQKRESERIKHTKVTQNTRKTTKEEEEKEEEGEHSPISPPLSTSSSSNTYSDAYTYIPP